MTLEWRLRDRVLRFERRPLVMGIVNVTPDSFSDGGQHASTDAAVAHALATHGAEFFTKLREGELTGFRSELTWQ